MRLILNNGKSVSRLYSIPQPPEAEFIFKINTNLGASPTYSYSPSGTTGINYTVDYGDGTVVNYTSNAYNTHTYSSHGIYTIKMLFLSGVNAYNFYVSEGIKITEIVNWGTYSGLNSMFRCFRLCTNLTTISATDYPDLTNVQTLSEMFVGCTSLIFPSSILNWDVSNVQDFTSAFRNSLFNLNISSWDFSSATTINRIVKDTPFNQPIETWNIQNVTSVYSSFSSSNLDNANYQNGIIGWTGWTSGAPTKTLKSNVTASFGTAKYEIGGESEDVRNYLTGTLGWTIIDGGGI
jgi:hypothetical protein